LILSFDAETTRKREELKHVTGNLQGEQLEAILKLAVNVASEKRPSLPS
jgi:hypothetical protein